MRQNIRSLDSIFKPKRIALVGVSINPNSVSGKVLSNLVSGRFNGVVYPINKTSEAVMGISCFTGLRSLPALPDLTVICSPASEVPACVRECGELGINGVIIMSAGMGEAGEEGLKIENEIKEIRSSYPAMRIIGPNCLGIIVPALNLNISFAPAMPSKGNIAFISQSGALCTSVLDWAREKNIGFSSFISLGNSIDVDFGHLIDYLGEDDSTRFIILYIESIRNARKFMSASRAFARTKPLIVYKAGRFPESAAAAASHTGALAAEDSIYDAVFQRTGIARVYDIGEIFNCAELLGRNKMAAGDKLAIVTNAGGPGVMATDALIEAGGQLAKLSPETMEELNSSLPPMWSHANPIDVIGDDSYKRLVKATTIVLKDKEVDAVLVILTPQAMTNIKAAARSIAELQKSNQKPILTSWLGGEQMQEGVRILIESKVANYQTPEQAVRAFMTLVEYSRNLKNLYETPRDIPLSFSLDRDSIRKRFHSSISQLDTILSEEISKQILHAYGIPVSLTQKASSEEEAIRISNDITYPVVFKILSPDITHKSDSGGVILNIANDAEAKNAYQKILSNVSASVPGATIEGVTVQPMIKTEASIELILGIKHDPVFGTVILVGAGGVTAELFKDSSLGFPPLNETLVRRMLERLKIWPLLKGYRGSIPVDIEKLIEIIIRLSYLAADFPEIKELDINPLSVGSDKLIALDARIIIKNSEGEDKEKYHHLSILPYPEEYVSEPMDVKGKEVIFRPIRPEDEPLWFDLLDSCSKESIYSRFNSFFAWSIHEVATRYCYIDYDREIAIVAEIEEEGARKIIGVGRLIA
ncbi:MAG: acetate--CoA ligase family protein, partial [Bacteroidales bacterium]|nr:acetate--CoA ligase family protein [Bacteroidales bacterium]